ncbi:hypothetical protein [Leptolyngbya sp. 7M]|uniref:hypothetical protein n=1 Tax=Leptolyngbya sp. 7M TaxID=2812896 RepID=UPI001B8B6045|nr:hypothetical protein [Leptolyngbya sp. 7M]QYO64925.1 hypothetical protein JVX88_36235 [Leptolyngbya sp. 7M]
MLLVQLVQDLVPGFVDLGAWSEAGRVWLNHSSFDWGVLAQQFDTDVFKGTRAIIGDFIQSGKLWTLLIGIGIGYMLRALTSYG